MSIEQSQQNMAKPNCSSCDSEKSPASAMTFIVKRCFWITYPVMLICFFHVLWLLNDRIDNIMYSTVPLQEKPLAFVDITTPVAGAVQKGMDIKLIKEPSAEMLKNGKIVFQDKCVMCHGSEGKGDGPAGVAIHARNFHVKDGWKNGRELTKMFGTLLHGTDAGMPSFDTLPVETRISLIHYVRTFANDYPEIKASEVEALDKQYNLTKDAVNPHRIPVKLALQLSLADAKEIDKKYEQITDAVSKDQSESALLLKSYTDSLGKTLVSLQKSEAWKTDVNSFVKFLTVNLNMNGVKPSLLLSDKKVLEEIFVYLKGIK